MPKSPMIHHRRPTAPAASISVTSLAPALLALGLFTAALTSHALGQDQCVLLRNGNVISGEVMTIGETVYVHQSDGSAVRLTTAQVASIGDSPLALYKHRIADRFDGDLSRLHRDIRWCLRNSLIDEAARDVLRARDLDPAHPETVQLLKQIVTRMKEAHMTSTSATTAEQSGAMIRQVAFETESSPAEQTPAAEPANDLTVESKTLFATRVQPILMNRCTGCHTRGESDGRRFQIHTAIQAKWAPKRVAEENLAAVLAFIDRSNPGNSEIRMRSIDHHGGRRASLGPSGSSMMITLDRWLSGLAEHRQDHDAEPPPLASTEPPQLLPVEWSEFEADQPGSVSEANFPAPPEPIRQTVGETGPVADTPKRPKMRRMPKVENPFDPEIFNRRFHDR